MKRLITASLAIYLLLLLTMACSTGDRAVLLRLKYEPHTRYTFQQEGAHKFKVTEGDSITQQGTSKMSVSIIQTVRRVLEDSTAEVSELATWDVEGPSKEDPTKIDTVHSNRELSLYLTPRGNVVDIEFTSVIDTADAEYVRDYYEQGQYVFPEEPVRKGTTWTQTADVKLPDTTAQAATTYTVKGFAKESGYDVALIDYEGNLVIPIQPSPKDSLHRSGIDRIHITGTMSFGYNLGQLVSATEKWAVDGDRERLLKDGTPSHFKVTMELESSIKLKSVDTDGVTQ